MFYKLNQLKKDMDKKIFQEIIKKKEFSKLPRKDVGLAFSHFAKRQVCDEEKIRLTRELLHKVYGAFASKKLLSLKDKDPEWILRKHQSTRERLTYYKEVYERILKNDCSIIDLGAGINGFSYNFFPYKVEYIAIEGVGQLVDLMNYYFKIRGLNGWAIHESLFSLDKLEKYITQIKGKKIVFLFKVLDNLEMLERDYSKKLLEEIVPLVSEVVISFATESMVSRKKFRVKRNWILDFLKERFKLIDDFEIGGERYLIVKK